MQMKENETGLHDANRGFRINWEMIYELGKN